MQAPNFEEILDRIVEVDPRYQREAYVFLREALDHTQKIVSKSKKKEIRHVSGQELLHGIKDYALSQYGPMTITVLAEWGIRSCEDFGEMVFNMVGHNLLAKTDKDRREDFKDAYDFDKVFRRPFLPSGKQNEPQPVQKGRRS